MSPLPIEVDRTENHRLPAFWHAQMIPWFAIYTLFAAETMLVGQLLCGLVRADVLAFSLSLCAFCIEGPGIGRARSWGVGGLGLAMVVSKIFTSSPIQLYKLRGILRVNRAPALIHQQLAVV